jgi:hypothetical protein
MPRNSSGVYTLPNPPVVPDTIIASLDENTTRSDIESELTNSLDRSGRGGMLAPFRTIDGTIGIPGLSWISETTSGWYRAGLNDFRFSIAGVDKLSITPTATTVNSDVTITGALTVLGPNPPISQAQADLRYVELSEVPNITNRIINGKFAIDQRNAGAAVGVTGSITFSVDRWAFQAVGAGSVGPERFEPTPGEFNLAINVNVAVPSLPAGDLYQVRQLIEGLNLADLRWGTANASPITVAFDVKASVAGSYSLSLSNGATVRTYIAPFTINAANTFETKTITIAGDTAGTWETGNATGLIMSIPLAAGSAFHASAANVWNGVSYKAVMATNTNLMATVGNQMFLRNVRLYKGSVDFGPDRRLYAEELALCQRYYQKSYDIATPPGSLALPGALVWTCISASNNNYLPIRFTVPMRSAPAVIGFNPSLPANVEVQNLSIPAPCSATAFGHISNTGCYVTALSTPASLAGHALAVHYTASAEL